MHFCLFVCIPVTEAETSQEAREAVAKYLEVEGFTFSGRFGGRADYFSIGGRWSGRLTLLRLKHERPRDFKLFWSKRKEARTSKGVIALFRKTYPKFRGTIPVGRQKIGFYGRKDDAQILDEVLFTELKCGFSNDANYTWELQAPNVISTQDYDESEWPKDAFSAKGKYWVVLVDYHD